MKKNKKLILITSLGTAIVVSGVGFTGTQATVNATDETVVSNAQFNQDDGTNTIVFEVPIEIVDSTTVEPIPVDPIPVEPIPVDPIPVEPIPVDPIPVEPIPVDPIPVDPTPVDPTPVNPTPVNPTPVNPTAVDPTPVDPTTSNQVQSTVQNVQGTQTTKSTSTIENQQQATKPTTNELEQTQPELPKTGGSETGSAEVLLLSFIASVVAGIGMIVSHLKTKNKYKEEN